MTAQQNGQMGSSTVTGQERGNKSVSHVLGEITWLMSQSKLHKNMFISDLEWMVMPAVLLEQFRIYMGPNSPAAVAFWAFVSKETDQALRDGRAKLRPDEWRGGDIPWLIELIAPFGAGDEILTDMASVIFKDNPYHFHTVENGQRVVKLWGGGKTR